MCAPLNCSLYLINLMTFLLLFEQNNIIGSFMRLEQLLVTNGYTREDLIIVSLPTADQISVIISSASLLAESNQDERKMSEGRKISTSSIDKKVSFDFSTSIQEEEPRVEENSVEVATVENNNHDGASNSNNIEANDVN